MHLAAVVGAPPARALGSSARQTGWGTSRLLDPQVPPAMASAQQVRGEGEGLAMRVSPPPSTPPTQQTHTVGMYSPGKALVV